MTDLPAALRDAGRLPLAACPAEASSRLGREAAPPNGTSGAGTAQIWRITCKGALPIFRGPARSLSGPARIPDMGPETAGRAASSVPEPARPMNAVTDDVRALAEVPESAGP
jgi:hypothetical protein